MDLEKMMTVENLLKVLLAIAIGVMLYKVFFAKETYYNYEGDKSDYAYQMDYEEDIDLVDAVDEPEDIDLDSADSEEDIEEIEDVVDAEDDMYEYADDENEAYDDSEEIVADVIEDAEDDMIYEDEVVDEEDDMIYEDEVVDEEDEVVDEEDDMIYEEHDDGPNYDFLYASDAEDGFQENFTLYSNLVGVDTNYD